MGLALGITLLRESALLAVALRDKETLARLTVDDFQDGTIRKGLAAAKALSEKPNAADVVKLKDVCKWLWGVEGEGKVLELLEAKVRCETNEANSRRELMTLVKACHRTRQPMAYSEALQAAKK